MATGGTTLDVEAAGEIAGSERDRAVPQETFIRRPVALIFAALIVLAAVEAAHEVFGLGGSRYSQLIDNDFYDIVACAAGVMLVVRGLLAPRERAWIVFGVGLLVWVAGDLVWDLNYGADQTGAIASVSDIFWLAWYPLAAVGLVMLIRSRLTGFHLGRWIDGIALALIVSTPAVALALQPAIEKSHISLLDHIVVVAYPALDILLLGAAVGVIALAGWRPGRSWYILSLGLSVWVIADAQYSVQQTAGTYKSGVYDWLWPAGAILIAFAAWQPRSVHDVEEPVGWRAIVLPFACQAIAMGTQVWGLAVHIGESERIMTIAVLAIVLAQLFIVRPRPEGAARARTGLSRKTLARSADQDVRATTAKKSRK